MQAQLDGRALMILQHVVPGGVAERLILPRRRFLLGAAALVAAPAIVRAGVLMPIKTWPIFPKKPAWRIAADRILAEGDWQTAAAIYERNGWALAIDF
jgi:hypothetical protein